MIEDVHVSADFQRVSPDLAEQVRYHLAGEQREGRPAFAYSTDIWMPSGYYRVRDHDGLPFLERI